MEDIKKDPTVFDSSVVLAAKSTVVAFPHHVPLQGSTKETSMSNMAANLIFYSAIGYENYGMNPAFNEAYNKAKDNGLKQFILRCVILIISLEGRLPEAEEFANTIL